MGQNMSVVKSRRNRPSPRVHDGRAQSRHVTSRPPRIASRMGRIRVAVRRAFIVSNGAPILARDVLVRAYPRVKQFQYWHRWSARRALLQVAEVIGRNRYGRGRPNLWLPLTAKQKAKE
jgi:hypothetical protein